MGLLLQVFTASTLFVIVLRNAAADGHRQELKATCRLISGQLAEIFGEER